ncbi:hypothetical protein [Methanobrevibacter sp.]|uniref:hypothetical protein n=1 Tax=Methanobrevibacter sp. TaxID=66852 RepID=UPI003890789E
MINRKIIVLTIFLLTLLTISTVSATDNNTCNTVNLNQEDTIGNFELIDYDSLNNKDINSDDVCESNEFLSSSSEENNIISADNESNIEGVSSLDGYVDYSVRVSDNSINYDHDGQFKVSISYNTSRYVIYDHYYKYYFYVYIYNSNNNLVVGERYLGTSFDSEIYHSIPANSLAPGIYTVNIVNHDDNVVMDTAKLTVRATYGSSVSVEDYTFNYRTGGKIYINITPDYASYYKYDFYLKIYDDQNEEVVNERFCGVEDFDSVIYNFFPSTFEPGVYTMKLVDTGTNKVKSQAKLTIRSYDSSLYSASVEDYCLDYEYGGTISIHVSQAMSRIYVSNYSYKFFLEICDSKNRLKVREKYQGVEFSDISVGYKISSDKFSPGEYTIKLIDADDYMVIDTAKLIIRAQSSYLYGVYVPYTSTYYGAPGNITMSITYDYSNSFGYDYYLKIYDANNVEKISARFYNSTFQHTRTYSLSGNELEPGSYTIKILNTEDNYVLRTANLTVNYPYYAYSVSVNDTNMIYNSDGNISISIYPTYPEKMSPYNFYLRIFDSNGVQKIDWEYSGKVKETSYKVITINSKTLNPGKYTIKIINMDDDCVFANAVLKVNKVPTKIVVSDVTATYNDNTFLVVTLKDQEGNLIKGEKLTIDFNGVKSYTSDVNGQVKVSTNGLVPKTYTATITFDGNVTYDKSSATAKVEVNKIKVSLYSSDLTVIYNVNDSLLVTLKDYNGKPIDGVNVSVNLNGEKILTTDVNGQIKVLINDLVPEDYIATVTFDGNNIYDKSTATVNVTVKKATPKITAKAKTFKKSVKTKKYTITLKNNLNKGIKNAKVKIKINKKTYTAKTNKKGKATFKIKKLTKKGTIKAKITYKGNSYYNKVTKKVKIKIK